VDPDLKNCLQRQSYNLYRLNQDFLEPELFEGPHYCTRIDANAIKTSRFTGFFHFRGEWCPGSCRISTAPSI